ncbi:hypothetical protein FHL15_009693 [Xylaria flabelliformis]|uniref:F-box domain-containing protein n=1 Tax=Xylaria flabelliformis TaxID=2512241 RepID=A0A553HN61_9PEZI|nr:hypothetical protein FHL15_009693 [Xylaria flabelliformis]
MALLQDLPNETLILILSFLGAIDLQSTLLAQRVSRRFQGVIQDAVLYSASNSRVNSCSESATGYSGLDLNPLLQAKFRGLFHSVECFTAAERARYWALTLDGDVTLPFRRLPWAADSSLAYRDAFLRSEASWRRLSPTFGTAPPIRHLDVVKSLEDNIDDPVAYFQVDIPHPGLSMGLLYDILLCEEALYGPDTGSWQLLTGKRLKSFDVLYRWGCFIDDSRGESQLVGEKPDAAILFVSGSEWCSHKAIDRHEWTPQRLTKNSRPKFLSWQGPLIDHEGTEWCY